MRMYNPPHPASILREDILPELGLSITDTAKALGVTRVAISRLLNEHTGISIDMAMRLEAWLCVDGQGIKAETWLKMQLAYDIWQAEHNRPIPNITPIQRHAHV